MKNNLKLYNKYKLFNIKNIDTVIYLNEGIEKVYNENNNLIVKYLGIKNAENCIYHVFISKEGLLLFVKDIDNIIYECV